MNKIVAVGRLVEDPEIVHVKDTNDTFSRFRFAIPGNFNKEQTSFVYVVAFGKTADIAKKYLHKGDMIALAGELKVTSYTTKKGEARLNVSISADYIEMLGSPKRKENLNEGEPVDTEELPF